MQISGGQVLSTENKCKGPEVRTYLECLRNNKRPVKPPRSEYMHVHMRKGVGGGYEGRNSTGSICVGPCRLCQNLHYPLNKMRVIGRF